MMDMGFSLNIPCACVIKLDVCHLDNTKWNPQPLIGLQSGWFAGRNSMSTCFPNCGQWLPRIHMFCMQLHTHSPGNWCPQSGKGVYIIAWNHCIQWMLVRSSHWSSHWHTPQHTWTVLLNMCGQLSISGGTNAYTYSRFQTALLLQGLPHVHLSMAR